MTDRIQELEDRNRELEQKVAQLTQQLTDQDKQLQDSLQELHRLQQHLLQMEKMSMLGQMVSGISHEINNPINFIYGNLPYVEEHVEDLFKVLEAYQEGYPDNAEAVEEILEEVELDYVLEDLPRIMGSLKVGAERIRDLVLTLRNFYRLDEPDMKVADIQEGLESTLVLLNNRYKQNIEVVCEFGKLPKIECYINQLNQVFMNLINNAIDALEEPDNSATAGGEKLERQPGKRKIIITTEALENNQVAITISDNGPGMSPDVENRVFEPFFTTKAMGVGTGLGLSISKKIIEENHHGKIVCTSQPTQGSTFRIELPVSQPKEAEEGADSEKPAVQV
ncbi:sensor histidine kinase [Laspinema olomoucense]|uniref:histidine kinase n=1 Tax=Laspinema olomoucense D3b TaxID=2953688 RepID=A0ABT2N3K3_9CYAN|nr:MULTISPECIES: ATP-binding protein [unclassified Laspinema]MCT7977162.1 ATP-binding protein [Laspinema sp. D3b]MCT7987575.1 ATP-binding protein [Laspinema sp. D3a]MCT7993666.1 ATP-binding protein [Laspinema sp. D3c]